MGERGPLSFGIKTSQSGIGYDHISAVWQEADAIEVIEHAWLWDHMVPLRGPASAPALEAWTLLAALAAQTRRLRLGVIVTNNQLRLRAAGQDGGDRGHHLRRPAGVRHRSRGRPYRRPR